MAKVIVELTNTEKPSKYLDYLDGQPWSLDMSDAPSGVKSLRSLLANVVTTARRHGIKVKAQIVGRRVEVQALGVNERDPGG